MNRVVAFAALFTSIGTLFCCALPALFVLLGAGATFASLTNAVPGILLFGEYKTAVFISAGICLGYGWFSQREASANVTCGIETNGETACATTQTWIRPLLIVASIMYLIGLSFAYVLPYFM